jgi:hypothetical protein
MLERLGTHVRPDVRALGWPLVQKKVHSASLNYCSYNIFYSQTPKSDILSTELLKLFKLPPYDDLE